MKRAAGFSLVELMVAMALGLVVTGAVIASFVGSRAASRSTAGVSALTDSGRFAISTLAQAVRSAGYMACSGPGRQLSILNGAAAPPVMYNFGQPVVGYEAVGSGPGVALALPAAPVVATGNTGDWVGNIDPSLVPGVPVTNATNKSDVLVVYSTLPGSTPVYVTVINGGTGQFTVSSLAYSPTANFANGQLAAISDCTKSIIFEVTGTAGSDLVHNAGGPAPGNSTNLFPAGLDFEPGAMVQPITTTVYYIGVGSDGDGALFSYGPRNGNGAFVANELAPDIESMQILYGIDTSPGGNGTVTQYVTANLVPDWTKVLTVEIALLAASPPTAVQPPTLAPTFPMLGTTVTAPKDSRRRQVFTTTINLRNTVS